MRAITGFSLVELLVTVSVVGLVLAFSIPSFSTMAEQNRRSAAINELTSHFVFARQAAILQAAEIVACPSTDGHDCARTRSWEKGWILFINRDRDSPPVRDAEEPRLRLSPALTRGLSLTANRDAFEFRPEGSSTNGTLVLCDPYGTQEAVALVVSVTGRTRLSRKTAEGAPLRCQW